MTNFIKEGNIITPFPKGIGYDLEPSKVYDLMYDPFGNGKYLKLNGSLNIPGKIYNNSQDKAFISEVLTYFKNTTKQTTGVFLHGKKGTGKTMLCKQIAIASKLPIIIPSSNFPIKSLNNFIKQFGDTPICIIFDEIEKTVNTEDLLTFLDGVESNTKKLVLMTANKTNNINENLWDRPSRIRYVRYFDNNDTSYIKEIIKDKGIEDKDNKIYEYISNNFLDFTIDNILSFLEEYILFGNNNNFDELVANLNISTKKKDAKQLNVDDSVKGIFLQNEELSNNSKEVEKILNEYISLYKNTRKDLLDKVTETEVYESYEEVLD